MIFECVRLKEGHEPHLFTLKYEPSGGWQTWHVEPVPNAGFEYEFWTNICPRKNKSLLSLTTGRASLVSNRALFNRRRNNGPWGPLRLFLSLRSLYSSFFTVSHLPLSGLPFLDTFFIFHFQHFFHRVFLLM